MTEIRFGDKVRIASTPDTAELGVAGRVGVVFGLTTPSVSNVAVVGPLAGDLAINVYFDEIEKGHWFSPTLLDFAGFDVGAEIRLDGIPKKWVKQNDGKWREIDIDGTSG